MPRVDPTPDLAVAMCTHNNLRTVSRALESVRDLAHRIVVVDSGSTDGTLEICRSFGADIIPHEWDGPTKQKQFAIDQCREHAWVLLLDSDESLEPELRESMRRVIEADDAAFVGWRINRKIWFLDGWLHYTFQPEWRLRLMRGGAGRVVGIGPEGRGGHDRVEVEGGIGDLIGVCRHDSWADLEAMCQSYIRFAQRAAAHYPRGGALWQILISPPATLFKQLILKRGLLDGKRGVIAAGGAAAGALLKHLFIAQRRFTASRAGREA